MVPGNPPSYALSQESIVSAEDKLPDPVRSGFGGSRNRAPRDKQRPRSAKVPTRNPVRNSLITAKTDRTLSLKTMTEKLTVERGEVESIQESSLSIMPEGLLEALTPDQQRDLIAYLMHRSQVPLPAGTN